MLCPAKAKSGVTRSSVTVSGETAGCHHTCIAVFLGGTPCSGSRFRIKASRACFEGDRFRAMAQVRRALGLAPALARRKTKPTASSHLPKRPNLHEP